jgi:transposase
MRTVREVLRLRFDQRLGVRPIAAAVGQSHGWVAKTLQRAAAAGIGWPLPPTLSDPELQQRLFGVEADKPEDGGMAPVDLAWVHRERRRPGVTLELLWHEYAESVARSPEPLRPYSYSRFCELCAAYRKTVSPSMRQVHIAGDKLFIDYSGRRPRIRDPQTGEDTDVELFVAVLGASNLTYAEATRSQKLNDFIEATVRALEYIGGVPKVLVPDQLRSAVSQPARHMPEINAAYAAMAAHYGCAVIPARPGRPRDKAKVEVAVQIAQRWILARLRNQTFFSLAELNRAIAELLEDLNQRPMRKLNTSRRALFDQHERHVLRPLPATRFEPVESRFHVGVGIDYCVEFDHRHYSVPRVLVQRRVDVHATSRTIEIFHQGIRVASHLRSHGPYGTAVINPDHRPHAHREYGQWPPERLERWAQSIGLAVLDVVSHQLRREEHPELRFRACLAIISLAKRYGNERLQAACAHALALRSPAYKTVHSILKHGLDRNPLPEKTPPRLPTTPTETENVRGSDYFDRGDKIIH